MRQLAGGTHTRRHIGICLDLLDFRGRYSCNNLYYLFLYFLEEKSPTKLNTSDIRNLSLGIEMKHFPSGRVFLRRAVSSLLGVLQYDGTVVFRTSSAIDFELSINVNSS